MMVDNASRDYSQVRQVGELWALKDCTDQYRAWKCWLQFQFKIRFFSRWLTVTSEWPPASQALADRYASWLSDIRDEVDKEGKGGHAGRPVPRHPEPWDGYIPPRPVEP